MEGEPDEKGEIVLTVGSPFPHSGDLGLADAGAEDATLVAQGYAALTALRGPRAEDDPELLAQLDDGLGPALLAGFAFAADPGGGHGFRFAAAVPPEPAAAGLPGPAAAGGRRSVVLPRRAPALLGLGAPALGVDPPHLGALRRAGSAPGSAAPAGPASSLVARRWSASSRLRACERESEALARTTGPSRSRRRARWRGPSVGEAATSNCTSTRLSVRLACWPPGPPEVVARQEISESGRSSPRCTCSVSSPATERA